VFKVFVANPKKTPEVVSILYKNKEKLIAYLENFHSDKDDAQFAEEKELIISTLSELEPPEDFHMRRDSEPVYPDALEPAPVGADAKQTVDEAKPASP
jgi:calcium binding protein 39